MTSTFAPALTVVALAGVGACLFAGRLLRRLLDWLLPDEAGRRELEHLGEW